MKIEHAALYVNDLERSKEFFLKYFDGIANDMYHNPVTGFRSYFISFDGGARLEIMSKPDTKDMEKPHDRTGYSHIAFSLGSRENVDSLTERLRADGYEIVSGPRTTGDGCYESCFLDNEGNRIELTE